MLSRSRIAAVVGAVLLTSGCGSSIAVRTMAAPDAGLATLQRFHMLPAPARRDGRPVTGADDPMIDNSIANRALREQIVRSFQDRGYTLDQPAPDFGVAFYATTRERLDVAVWDYGYPINPRWGHFPVPMQSVAPYTEGTIVIDVVNDKSRELLWRGEGRAELSNDPSDNVKQLAKAAQMIVDQFPHAVARAIASR